MKAQIKMRIRTATGAPMVVIRSFQLTQKKTALQFKALDQARHVRRVCTSHDDILDKNMIITEMQSLAKFAIRMLCS